MKLSSATKRALERNYYQNCDWFCDFRESDINGLGMEENIHRRDPSSVILVDGLYYVYYTRSVGKSVGFGTGDDNAKVFPWDQCDIWYAVSKDGYNWEEKGMAVGRGAAGEYDDRSVFTPEVLVFEGRYYLVYQVIKAPYRLRSYEYIAMAQSDSPEGPFVKSKEPILAPSKDGKWIGDTDNRFLALEKGSFDSLKVHDPLLFAYRGKFYLYYKGETFGEQLYMGGRETKWGVAIADKIEGPYIKSEYNPVTNSGHETCLWQYKDGIAAFLRTDGVEKNTIQFAEDGINFEIKSVIKGGPEACGPFRPEVLGSNCLDGMTWGLCHDVNHEWGFLKRFDIDLTQKLDYCSRSSLL